MGCSARAQRSGAGACRSPDRRARTGRSDVRMARPRKPRGSVAVADDPCERGLMVRLEQAATGRSGLTAESLIRSAVSLPGGSTVGEGARVDVPPDSFFIAERRAPCGYLSSPRSSLRRKHRRSRLGKSGARTETRTRFERHGCEPGGGAGNVSTRCEPSRVAAQCWRQLRDKGTGQVRIVPKRQH